jgi:hypothetical protein
MGNLITPGDICTFALKAAGILGVGQTASPDDISDVFSSLNAMIGSWNKRRWLVFQEIDVSIVSTGAKSYSIGPFGDINTSRPDRIESAFFRQTPSTTQNQSVDYPLEILQSREDYNQIALKTLVSWPTYIFYDPAFPLGNVYPWPIPQASLYELHLSLKVTISNFSSYTQSINLPAEYFEALWTNLCLRLGAFYPGCAVNDDVRALAKASLAAIETANTQIPRLSIPRGLTRPALYNIFSDQTY